MFSTLVRTPKTSSIGRLIVIELCTDQAREEETDLKDELDESPGDQQPAEDLDEGED